MQNVGSGGIGAVSYGISEVIRPKCLTGVGSLGYNQ